MCCSQQAVRQHPALVTVLARCSCSCSAAACPAAGVWLQQQGPRQVPAYCSSPRAHVHAGPGSQLQPGTAQNSRIMLFSSRTAGLHIGIGISAFLHTSLRSAGCCSLLLLLVFGTHKTWAWADRKAWLVSCINAPWHMSGRSSPGCHWPHTWC